MSHAHSRGRRVFLVRHGQTGWNATGRAQGQTEVPLDEIGRAQAHGVAEHLARTLDPHRPAELWTSDLGRARETAHPIVERAAVALTVHPELRERAFGEWEGEPLADIRLRLQALADERGVPVRAMRPPGGESLDDVWQRVEPIAERLREALALRSVVVVSHGGFSSLLLARLLSGSPETARSFRLRNASVTELELRPDGSFQLHRFDDVRHLLP